jgi:predicted TPR repeat methyltransferase
VTDVQFIAVIKVAASRGFLMDDARAHARHTVDFHTKIAEDFHDSYKADANRLERMQVWNDALGTYASDHYPLAYDIGCGTGRLTGEIALRADKVIAIDGAEGMLAIAERYLAQLGLLNTEFRHAMLPIADTAGMPPAPLVISSSVIEYVPDLEGAMAMLAKLMTPGGVLIFSMSNKHSLNRAVVRTVFRLTGKPEYFGHVIHFVDPAQLKTLVEGVGLQLVETRYFGGKDKLNRVLSALFPKRMSTNMVMAIARRPV